MAERPALDKRLDGKTFRDYYYLKEELIAFCRGNGLPASGSKEELTDRVAHFLDTGEVKRARAGGRRAAKAGELTPASVIEEDFVCSEKHRAFFKEHIGGGFSFNVAFQRWLKSNAGKSYAEAVEAYYRILEDRKKAKPEIDRQFEYNRYIRDFFEDNKGRSLQDAITCWKHKKQLPGHNRYERADLAALG